MQRSSGRTLAAVLFTDMVDSTSVAEELGDRRWKALVDAHHRIVRRSLKRFRGTEHDTAGDGFFASFKEPASAIACACEAAEAVRDLGIEIRAGVHFGECEQMGHKLGGITVVVGARIMSLGGAGEVLVSGTAAELSRGAGFGFEDRGMQQLKGVDGPLQVYAATAVDGTPRSGPLDPVDAAERRGRIMPTAGRRRRLVPALVALAVLVVAVAVPVAIQRLDRGLPGVDADAVGVIDASNGSITTQIPLGDMPNGIATGAGSTWVALGATDQVARIDPENGTITQRIDVEDDPIGVAYGDDAVWVTNGDARSVSRVDPASQKQVDTIEVGNAPSAIAFGDGSLWVTNSLDGTLARIDAATGDVDTFPVGADPIGVALGAGSIWVANQASGNVARINPDTGDVTRSIPVGAGPSGIAFDGGNVWVANSQAGTVTRISPVTNEVTGTVQTGGAPSQVAAGNGFIWVGESSTDAVVRIDPAGGGSVAGTTPIGSAPLGLTFDGDAIWVSTRGSAASHQGGTLLVESSGQPGPLDPNASYDDFSYAILSNTNDGLLGFARVGGTAGSTLVPDLARSIPSATGHGTTYTFDLRPDIHYSDGSTVLPSDVLSSFQRVLLIGKAPIEYLSALRGARRCSEASCNLSAGIKPDDAAGTITFHLTRADPAFLDGLALPGMAIVPTSTPRELVDNAPFVPATGPYMIASVTAGNDATPGEIHLIPNPFFHEWSRAAQPAGFPAEIVVRFGLDLSNATTDVLDGPGDVLLGTPDPSRRREIQTRYAAQIHPYTALAVYYVFLNTQVAPFSVAGVRRAVNFALDRTKMANDVGPAGLLGEGGPPTCQVLPPNVPGYAPYCPYTLNRTSDGEPDMDAAQSMVDASGTKNDAVTIWAPLVLAKAARDVESVLDKLGYRATTQVVSDFNAYFAYVGDPTNHAQVGMAGWGLNTPNPSEAFDPSLTCPPPAPFNINNLAAFCSPALDRRIHATERLGATDPARANALWTQIDRDVVRAAPWVPFTNPEGTILVSARVGNVQHNPVLGPLLGQMWVQ